MVYSTPDPEVDCLLHLKIYYGVPPYENHQSHGSGIFYAWTIKKFGREMVEKCEKELGVGSEQ